MMTQQSRERTDTDYRTTVKRMLGWLQEKQAEDMVALDIQAMNSVTDGVIVASAANVRHAQALTDWLMEKLSENKIELLGIEGYRSGTWVLIDCNDIVVHIFQKDYRQFYNLEGLWRDAGRIEGA
jgi:ribosome-associated protein